MPFAYSSHEPPPARRPRAHDADDDADDDDQCSWDRHSENQCQRQTLNYRYTLWADTANHRIDCQLIVIILRCGQHAVSVINRSCPSVRRRVSSFVSPVDRQQQRRPAGLLLKSGAGSRYRVIAAATARRAGSVNFGPTVRKSNILVTITHHRMYDTMRPIPT